jgi:hypothetical protein
MSLNVTDAASISSKYTPSDEEQRFHAQLAKKFADNQDDMTVGKEGLDVGIELLDRMISVINLEGASFDIWMEDENDILIQALPASGGRVFPNFELARRQWNNVMRRVFSEVPGVSAMGEFFGPRTGDWYVSRKSDPKDAGRDMFQIRLNGLYRRPRSVDAAVDAVKLYNNVLLGREVPVQ